MGHELTERDLQASCTKVSMEVCCVFLICWVWLDVTVANKNKPLCHYAQPCECAASWWLMLVWQTTLQKRQSLLLHTLYCSLSSYNILIVMIINYHLIIAWIFSVLILSLLLQIILLSSLQYQKSLCPKKIFEADIFFVLSGFGISTTYKNKSLRLRIKFEGK